MSLPFKRKILIVDKDFQIRFVKKFASITLLGSVISIAIILVFYYFSYKYGGRDLYRFLIEVGSKERVEISPKDKLGRTPLFYASNYKTASFLISKGANVYEKDQNGYTPLHVAALKGNLDVARLFYENGANYDSPANDGNDAYHLYINKFKATALHWWAGTGHSKKFLEVLSKNLSKIDMQNLLSQSPLHLAALYGRFDIARILISKKANIELKDKNGKTPLFVFIDQHHSTPLHWWVALNNLDLVKATLAKFPSLLNSQDEDESTALHIAVKNQNIKIVQFLLSQKADFKIPDKQGKTALDIAQESRVIPLVKVFYQ